MPAEGDSILFWSLGRKLSGPLRLGRRAPRNGRVGISSRCKQSEKIPDPFCFPVFPLDWPHVTALIVRRGLFAGQRQA